MLEPHDIAHPFDQTRGILLALGQAFWQKMRHDSVLHGRQPSRQAEYMELFRKTRRKNSIEYSLGRMHRAWLRVLFSFVCGFLLVLVLYRTSSEMSAFEYPPPPAGSWRAISHHVGETVWSVLDWSGGVFYYLFPPPRGQKITIGAIVGPIITNIVVASALFYVGLTFWMHRRA